MPQRISENAAPLPTMVLIGRDGRIRQRFGPANDEKSIAIAIEAALTEPTK